MKKLNKIITLSVAAAMPLLGATNAELEAQLLALKAEFEAFKKAHATPKKVVKKKRKKRVAKKSTPKKVVKTEPVEVVSEESIPSTAPVTTVESSDDTYESFSDLGLAASKVYQKKESALSIGGYGEFKLKKYRDFKNYANATNNETRNKLETNVLRFIPYFGYKFNDWIVMNAEIEFEDGGARSDGERNYKYAIVEFAYLDFMFDEKYNLRVGHVLVPFGNINLNHEPVSFLTSERPLVETFIIPSTWHTNGMLLYGTISDFDYYAGLVTSPDAGKFIEGRFIQQGRLGAKQFTDDFSFVSRLSYKGIPGLEIGGSLYYGTSTVLAQDKPGDAINTLDADVTITMAEAHIGYQANGWNIQALAVVGKMSDEYVNLNTTTDTIAGSVNGQYLTVGYDFLHNVNSDQKLYGVAEIERLDLDADSETAIPDNYKFNEYTIGLAYYPTSKVVIKAEYSVKDYADGASLADEKAFIAALGFIF
jgi:hypothetical protein